jgi:hypothetical protein
VVTSLEAAQAELAESMVPWPDDFMMDYHLNSALLFARQVAMCTAKVAVAFANNVAESPDEPQPVLDEVQNGIAAAVMGLTHALVALEVLPPEAEEVPGNAAV